MPQPLKVWIPIVFVALAVCFSFIFTSHYSYSDNLWRWLLFCSIGLRCLFICFREMSVRSGNKPSFHTLYTHLGLGMAGLLAPWMNESYWIALSLIQGILLWGTAYDYMKNLMHEHNFMISHCSPALVADLLIPIAFVILCILHFWQNVAVVI